MRVYYLNRNYIFGNAWHENYFSVSRAARSDIMVSDEEGVHVETCTTDEYNYICDTLPESWLLALNIGSSIYKYRLR